MVSKFPTAENSATPAAYGPRLWSEASCSLHDRDLMAFENLLQREPWLLGDDYLAAGAPALSDLDECKAPAGSRVDELEPFGVLTRFNEFSRVSIPLAS